MEKELFLKKVNMLNEDKRIIRVERGVKVSVSNEEEDEFISSLNTPLVFTGLLDEEKETKTLFDKLKKYEDDYESRRKLTRLMVDEANVNEAKEIKKRKRNEIFGVGSDKELGQIQQLFIRDVEDKINNISNIVDDKKEDYLKIIYDVAGNVLSGYKSNTLRSGEANIILNVVKALASNLGSMEEARRIVVEDLLNKINDRVQNGTVLEIKTLMKDLSDMVKSKKPPLSLYLEKNKNITQRTYVGLNESYIEYIKVLEILGLSLEEIEKAKNMKTKVLSEIMRNKKNLPLSMVYAKSIDETIKNFYKELTVVSDSPVSLTTYLSSSLHKRFYDFFEERLRSRTVSDDLIDSFSTISGRGGINLNENFLNKHSRNSSDINDQTSKVFILNKEEGEKHLAKIVSSVISGNDNFEMIKDGIKINDFLLQQKFIDKKSHQEFWNILNYGKSFRSS